MANWNGRIELTARLEPGQGQVWFDRSTFAGSIPIQGSPSHSWIIIRSRTILGDQQTGYGCLRSAHPLKPDVVLHFSSIYSRRL